MNYYRIAYQTRNETNLKWKSTKLTSLGAVFQILRRYCPLPQDRVRVFRASSPEEMDKQLVQENNGLRSHSVAETQFIQEHMISHSTEYPTLFPPGIIRMRSAGKSTLIKRES